jgi:hypothetical protein
VSDKYFAMLYVPPFVYSSERVISSGIATIPNKRGEYELKEQLI